MVSYIYHFCAHILCGVSLRDCGMVMTSSRVDIRIPNALDLTRAFRIILHTDVTHSISTTSSPQGFVFDLDSGFVVRWCVTVQLRCYLRGVATTIQFSLLSDCSNFLNCLRRKHNASSCQVLLEILDTCAFGLRCKNRFSPGTHLDFLGPRNGNDILSL